MFLLLYVLAARIPLGMFFTNILTCVFLIERRAKFHTQIKRQITREYSVI
jgi:hypothetical protein